MAAVTPIITTADIIFEAETDSGEDGIVVIERANSPQGFAIPGGQVEPGEDVWDTAFRESKEETTLIAKVLKLFMVYGGSKRDPRGNYQTTVFICPK
jgi:8-oxo-dGTP diphosphatase